MGIAIVQFGGSNCDLDILHVLTEVLDTDASLVWYKEEDLGDYDAVIIPGGFSYGDYLRSGAIASRTPVMDSIRRMAGDGKPVMGICNGFQILTESGLLDGALTTNRYPRFRCQWTDLKVENTDTPFTSGFSKGQVVRIPIAHKDGNYYIDDSGLAELEADGRVAFRYVDSNGEVSAAANPNGSRNNIAGICNSEGNVLGLMPHPERASEEVLGSADGLAMFTSLIASIG
jgi:phosphoribosylformylglycinamidine synthase